MPLDDEEIITSMENLAVSILEMLEVATPEQRLLLSEALELHAEMAKRFYSMDILLSAADGDVKDKKLKHQEAVFLPLLKIQQKLQLLLAQDKELKRLIDAIVFQARQKNRGDVPSSNLLN